MSEWPEPFPSIRIELELSKVDGDLTLKEGSEICEALERATYKILEKLHLIGNLQYVPCYDIRVRLDDSWDGAAYSDTTLEPAVVPEGFMFKKRMSNA